MKRLVLLAICLILVTFIAGCTGGTQYQTGASIADQEQTQTTPTSSTPTTKTTEKIEIIDHKMEYGEYGNLMVTGTAKNVGNSQLSYAEIRVKFYDKDNNLLETFMDNVNDLDAGQTWKFKVLYPSMNVENVDHYDIGVGTTYP